MAKSKGRPSWFKMFDSQKTLIDSVSDDVAGKALKAAFAYFDDRETDIDLDPLTFAVFSTIKQYIDESYADYQRFVKKGEEGADKRWGRNSPPIAPL